MKAGTAILSDAMGKTGAMDHDMRCWSARCRMAGKAFTAKVHPADILMVGIALSSCPQEKVLVIDGQGELNTALVGWSDNDCRRLKGVGWSGDRWSNPRPCGDQKGAPAGIRSKCSA